jgi:hypothetical protein
VAEKKTTTPVSDYARCRLLRPTVALHEVRGVPAVEASHNTGGSPDQGVVTRSDCLVDGEAMRGGEFSQCPSGEDA